MALPVATLQTLADFLVTGYWTTFADENGQGYPPHHFDHTNVTYTFAGMTGPNAQAQSDLAKAALQMWDDVCGLTFTEVASGGELYFSNQGKETEANATPIFEASLGGIRYVGATIVMTQSFFAAKGSSIDSYSFEAYVHEIGHALGLGHQGPYNVDVPEGYNPTYSVDAAFANDTKQFSIMSYFGQSNFGASSDVGVFSPQMADILAVQSLYGAADTRPGNTIYGTNSNAGDAFDFGIHAAVPAFTIYDSDGTDLLDCSAYSNYPVQYIDLTPGAYSSVGGLTNNIGIWRLTTIENAKGGSGFDYIIGNDAANGFDGGSGDDTLLGRDGDDELTGGEGVDTLEGGNHDDILKGGGGADRLDGGDGFDTASYADSPVGVVAHLWMGMGFGGDADGDTYLSIENLRGSMHWDVLSGDDGPNRLVGEDGTDFLTGAGGADELIGGEGEDTAQYRASGAGVDVDLGTGQGHLGEAEGDLLSGIENVYGSNFNDRLVGDVNRNILAGHDGKDELKGGGGDDRLEGGVGDDTYILIDVTPRVVQVPLGFTFTDVVYDDIIEEAGEGVDTVRVQRASAGLIENTGYTLPANFENGEVIGTANFDLSGNELANKLIGNGASNTLNGGDGNDTLDGESGFDTLKGGAHNDTYVLADVTTTTFRLPNGLSFEDTVYDKVIEEADQGLDTVEVQRASDGAIEKTGYTLPANVENGEVHGAGNFNLTGNGLENQLVGNSAANRLKGEGGNDILKGGGGDDILDGGDDFDFANYGTAAGGVVVDLGIGSAQNTVSAGLDTLIGIEGVNGSAFDDVLLRGFVASATLRGEAGDDVFHDHNFGSDTFDGGDDSDTIDYLTSGNESVRIDLAAGLATSVGGSVNTLLSIENAAGSNGSDRIVGNAEANRLDGRDGADIIDGGPGDDTLDGGAMADSMDGKLGFDVASYISAASGIQAFLNAGLGAGLGGDAAGDLYTSIEGVTGSNFADVLVGNDASVLGVANTMNGGGGDDTIYGEGIDTVTGGDGNDVFFGGSGEAVTLNLATSGIETVWGSVAGDLLDGATANVPLVFIGAPGADAMSGGLGADFLYYDHLDTITGGQGNDWAVATLSSQGVSLNMNATGFENTWGSPFNDTLSGAGSASTVVIVGDVGNDTITGGNSFDFLYGFGGDDTLIGSPGGDVMLGGPGNDTYAYVNPSEGFDSIFEFLSGSDKFQFTAANFGKSAGDVLDGTSFKSGAAPASTHAMPTWLHNTGTGILTFDQDGTGVAFAPVPIAQIFGAPTVAASDIRLVA